MDGNLLVFVADAATHGSDALGLKTREEHLLTDAVGLQTLSVDVETDLLLLFAKEFYVGNRWDAAQTVTEVIAVLFQFSVTALRALDGDKQGRCVAKLIVGDDSQHALGQL